MNISVDDKVLVKYRHMDMPWWCTVIKVTNTTVIVNDRYTGCDGNVEVDITQVLAVAADYPDVEVTKRREEK